MREELGNQEKQTFENAVMKKNTFYANLKIKL